MISIRDRKLGLGFGDSEKMKKNEYESDPDIALSHIDEKLQNVLGHLQKDFEGEVSAENLGAKFGGYGTFLDSYPRYPACQRPQTPQKMHSSNTPRSQNNLRLEGAETNSLVPSSTSLLPSRGSTPATKLLNDSVDDVSKRKEKMSSAQCVEESSSGCETEKKFPRVSQRSLRVRIKVGSVNLSTQRNSEIYNGLGLDMSPSASADGSPIGSEVSREPFSPPKESPTRILQIMTSFPLPGSVPLSPLSNDLISLSERPEFRGESKCKISQQVSKAKKSGRVKGGKHKSSSTNDLTFELKNDVNKGSQNVVSSADERLVGDSGICSKVKREFLSDTVKVEAGSTELIDWSELEARSLQEDYSASGSSKKPTEIRSQVGHSVGFVKENSNTDGSLLHKRRKSESALTNHPKSAVEDSKPQKNLEKVKDTYRDFFGDMDLEQDYNSVDSEDILCNNNQEGIQVVEKYVSKITSKENTYGKKRVKSSKPKQNPKPALTQAVTTGSQPISEAVPGTEEGIPLVQEDWVSCDKCQKWRLLPLGTNPDDLPEKWLCSMLNWLPGMNRCSFSEEETTKALLASHHVPAHADDPRGSTLADASIYDEKKRNGVQDVSVSENMNVSVLNSAKNAHQALLKNSSFNGCTMAEVEGVQDNTSEELEVNLPVKKQESRDEMLSRHRKEISQLQDKETALKKGAAKGSKAEQKAKKKQVEELVTELSTKLKEKHADELASLGYTSNNGDEKGRIDTLVKAIAGVSVTTQSEPSKPSKSAKRRGKRAQEEAAREQRIQEEQDNIVSDRMIEDEKLEKKLQPIGSSITQIKPDGHCLYRAVEDQLAFLSGGSSPYNYLELRQMVATYMRNHAPDFLPFFLSENIGDGVKDSSIDERFEKYCSEVENTAAWGGQLELGALTHCLKKHIMVLSGSFPDVEMGKEYKDLSSASITLSYHRHAFGLGEHYNSVVPVGV